MFGDFYIITFENDKDKTDYGKTLKTYDHFPLE